MISLINSDAGRIPLVDYTKYDLVHVGISGGKDSQAVFHWMRNFSDCSPEKIIASFCDTKNEHDLTYQHIEYMRQTIGPIETISAELGFYELAKRKKRFPSIKGRFCTQYLKMQVTQRYLLDFMRAGKIILLITGVRKAESLKRLKLEAFGFDMFYGQDIYRPILDWSTEQVFQYIKDQGMHHNPLYDYGARRVGCFPCINSVKKEIRIISEKFPERIDMIREQEKKIGASFFSSEYVPVAHRKHIFTSNGKDWRIANIDDVVEWSHTARGGKQFEMDLDEPFACDSSLGHCE